MIRNDKNHVFVDHLLEELESYGLKIGMKLEELESEKNDYLFFMDVLDQLKKSRIDFCSSYFSLSEEEKELFYKKLIRLFKDQGIVDSIIQEIINLYYLNERGLLEKEDVSFQKEVALENLDTLATKIEKYLDSIHYDLIIMNHDKLSKQMDDLMLLGSILEEDGTPLEDFDFLKDTLEALDLTNEEKKRILIEILQYNGLIYQEQMKELKESLSPPNTQVQRFIMQKEEKVPLNPKGLDDMLGDLIV
ncbi:MAG: hypothetical protein IKF71_03705 [Bacilli bacterium]|nr:hypothetical protein [Bacilli bacterium]